MAHRSDVPVDRGPTPLLRDQAAVAGRALIIAVAVAAALWFAMQISIVTVSAFFGFAIAALLWPVVTRLRRVMPHVLAVLVAVVLALVLIALPITFLVSRLIDSAPALTEAVVGGARNLAVWSDEVGLDLPEQFSEDVSVALSNLTQQAGGALASGLGAVGTFFTIVGLSLFVTIFALSGGGDLARQATNLLPEGWRDRALESLKAMVYTARAWLGASTLTGIGDGLLIGFGLWYLGVPLAVPIAMLTFFAGFIPTIGAFLAGALAVAVALFSGGINTALWTLLLVVIVQQLQGNVFEPLLLSRAMHFPPLLTLLLTTTGGLLFGLTGLILTVPVAGFITAGIAAWHGRHPTQQVDDDKDEDPDERIV